jgi:hypothetical protein
MGAALRLHEGLGRLRPLVDDVVNEAERMQARMMLMAGAGVLDRRSAQYLRLSQELQSYRAVQGHLATAQLRTGEVLGI